VRRSLDADGARYRVIARLVEGLSYCDEDVDAEQSYRYSVRVFDADGNKLGHWTAAVSVTVPAAQDGG
jgi:hypothetical protein